MYRYLQGLLLLLWLPTLLAAEPTHNYQALRTANQNQTLWLDNGHLNQAGLTLTSLLADLGLRASALLSETEKQKPQQTDQQLTLQLLNAINRTLGHQVPQPLIQQVDLLQAINQQQLDQLIDQHLPRFEQMLALRSAIARFRTLSKMPWPQLAKDFQPKLGKSNPQVQALKNMLSLLGDLPSHTTTWWDPQSIAALKAFQLRMGLTPHGQLDTTTKAALNITPIQRLAILQRNLQRLLSLPAAPPAQYIEVNIPDARLNLFASGHVILSMPVIVGAPDSQTPLMVTEVSSISLNPLWRPPASIIQRELLPALRTNPKSYDQQGFRWQSPSGEFIALNASQASQAGYRLVQLPGPHNALGQYRFNIKNHDAIYLHDTPAKSLFRQEQRALSHGCIRLADAQALAMALIDLEPAERQQRLTQQLAKETSFGIALTQSIPVYLNYQSVVIRADGKLQWLADPYGLDQITTPQTSSLLALRN